jgi:hypothetical protein
MAWCGIGNSARCPEGNCNKTLSDGERTSIERTNPIPITAAFIRKYSYKNMSRGKIVADIPKPRPGDELDQNSRQRATLT